MYSEETQKKQREYDAIVEPEKQQSAYDPLYQAAVKKYAGRGDFSYNADEDPLFAQYKDSYTKQGRMAMEDTIGKASSMTGGYGNSYAQQAGQQTFNGYMSALNDKIPELYQLAAANYDRKVSGMLNDISVLGGAVDRDDARYQTALNNYYQKKNLVGNELSRLQSNDLSTAAAQAAAPSMSYEDLESYTERLLPYLSEDNGNINDERVLRELLKMQDIGLVGEREAGTILRNVLDAYGDQKDTEKKKAAELQAYKEKPLNEREWVMQNNGGFNWWGGIDKDAIVYDKNDPGTSYKLGDLFEKLKDDLDMDADDARDYIYKIQNMTGASNSAAWWDWS